MLLYKQLYLLLFYKVVLALQPMAFCKLLNIDYTGIKTEPFHFLHKSRKSTYDQDLI